MRRRRMLLLLALLPMTLGIATLAVVWDASGSGGTTDDFILPATGAIQRGEESGATRESVRTDHLVIPERAPQAPERREPPKVEVETESAPSAPPSPPSENAAPMLLAAAAPETPAAPESARVEPMRLAAVSFGGAGGGGRAPSKDGSSDGDEGGGGPSDPSRGGETGGAPAAGKDTGEPSAPSEGTPPSEQPKGPGSNDRDPKDPVDEHEDPEEPTEPRPPYFPDPVIEQPVQVPEPGTIGLLLLGLLGCTLHRRKR